MPPPDLGPSDVARDIEKAEIQASRQLTSSTSSQGALGRTTSYASTTSTSASIDSVDHQSITRHRTLPDTVTADFGNGSGADALHPLVLERQRTAASIYARTVGAAPQRVSSKTEKWPEFGGGKPYPPFLPHHDKYLVDFAGPDDPLHGQNWPVKKK